MKFKIWQMGCFKFSCLETSCFQMGGLSEVAYGQWLMFSSTLSHNSNLAGTGSMPDLKDPQTKDAAVKIQAVFRGFQTRKKVQDDLSNLKCAKVGLADSGAGLTGTGAVLASNPGAGVPGVPSPGTICPLCKQKILGPMSPGHCVGEGFYICNQLFDHSNKSANIAP